MGALDNIITGAVNTGLGLILEKHQDQRQLNQQEKLGQQQLKFNMSQMDYQNKLAYDLWQKTNYPGQVKQLEKAGLNPGLLYGLSGGGGSTTGSTGGNVNTPNAPAGGNEILGLQLMGAQKRLLEAQAKKTEAEANKTAGIDTDIAVTQAKILEIERSLKHDTYEAAHGQAIAAWAKLEGEAMKVTAEGLIANKTVDTEIATKQAEMIGIMIANELNKNRSNLTEAKIQETIESIAQKWRNIAVQEGRLNLERFVHDVSESTKLTVQTVTNLVGQLVKPGAKITKGGTTINNTRNFN